MPRLAVFPKGFMDQLCVTRELSLPDWFRMAATLDVDGVELYDGFFTADTPAYYAELKAMLADLGLAMPMLCYSPDFTIPEAAARRAQIDRTIRLLDAAAAFGAVQCRVLSGQARPEVSRQQGLDWVVECLEALLPEAEARGLHLAIENHYKDGYWQYREFAQKADVFLELLDRVPSPWLRVNYDPSNALVAGDDPLALLEAVKHRVITMHASDRYLASGDLESLREADGTLGYPKSLVHGIIGQGLNDYDRIFTILRGVGFDGWISIEDGEDGLEPLAASARFLRRKMAEHF